MMEKIDTAGLRKSLNKIWRGSGPGMIDLTADSLGNFALHTLNLIEQQQEEFHTELHKLAVKVDVLELKLGEWVKDTKELHKRVEEREKRHDRK